MVHFLEQFPPWCPSLAFASLRRRITKSVGSGDPSIVILEAAKKAAAEPRARSDLNVAEALFSRSLEGVGVLTASEVKFLWESVKPSSSSEEFRLSVLTEFGSGARAWQRITGSGEVNYVAVEEINRLGESLHASAAEWVKTLVGIYATNVAREDFLKAIDLPQSELRWLDPVYGVAQCVRAMDPTLMAATRDTGIQQALASSQFRVEEVAYALGLTSTEDAEAVWRLCVVEAAGSDPPPVGTLARWASGELPGQVLLAALTLLDTSPDPSILYGKLWRIDRMAEVAADLRAACRGREVASTRMLRALLERARPPPTDESPGTQVEESSIPVQGEAFLDYLTEVLCDWLLSSLLRSSAFMYKLPSVDLGVILQFVENQGSSPTGLISAAMQQKWPEADRILDWDGCASSDARRLVEGTVERLLGRRQSMQDVYEMFCLVGVLNRAQVRTARQQLFDLHKCLVEEDNNSLLAVLDSASTGRVSIDALPALITAAGFDYSANELTRFQRLLDPTGSGSVPSDTVTFIVATAPSELPSGQQTLVLQQPGGAPEPSTAYGQASPRADRSLECLRKLLLAHRRVIRSIDWAVGELERRRAPEGASLPGTIQWVTVDQFTWVMRSLGVMQLAGLSQDEMHLLCHALEDSAHGPGRVSLRMWRHHLEMEYFLEHQVSAPIGRAISADPARFWGLGKGIKPAQLSVLAGTSSAEAKCFLEALGGRSLRKVASALYSRRALLEGSLRVSLENLFDMYDKDHSGTVDAKELRSCLVALGSPTNLDPAQLPLWLRQVGVNLGDNGGRTELTKDQFVRLMGPVLLMELDWLAVGQAKPIIGILEDFFREFDDDATSSLDLAEFRRFVGKFMKEAVIKLTESEVGLLFNDLDKNGDGEVDIEEFMIGFKGWLCDRAQAPERSDGDLNLALAKYKLRHTRPLRILEAAAAFSKLPSSCRLAPIIPADCLPSRTLLAPLSSSKMDAVSGLLSTDPMLAAALLLDRKKSRIPRASELNLDRSELPPDEVRDQPGGWFALCGNVLNERVGASRWSPLRLRREMAKAVMHGTEFQRLKQSFISLTVSAVQGVEPTVSCENRRLRFTWYSNHLGRFVPGISSWEVDYVVDAKQPSSWIPEDPASFPLLLHLPSSIERDGLCLLVDALVCLRQTDGKVSETPTVDVSVAWTTIPANEILHAATGYSREIVLHGGSIEWKENVQGTNRAVTGLKRLFTGPVADPKMAVKFVSKPSTEQLQALTLLPDRGYICPIYFAELAQLYRLYCFLITHNRQEQRVDGAALFAESTGYTGSLIDPVVVVFPAIGDDSVMRREFLAAWRAELKEMPRDQQEDDMSLLRLLQALCLRFWLIQGNAVGRGGGDGGIRTRFNLEIERTGDAREAQQWPWQRLGGGQVRSVGREKSVEDFRSAQSTWLIKEVEASGWLHQPFRPMHSNELTDTGSCMVDSQELLASLSLTRRC
ncbi:calcium binding protein 4 [Perkinsus olseni]|uniref:Calcium binding protein 4 n=1 Tax=Perkinsus olseni TaxID=32597 RepID=A0A7J6SH93_PEROL|nr:calcium binding protein 4 [Perkinsus olseni]